VEAKDSSTPLVAPQEAVIPVNATEVVQPVSVTVPIEAAANPQMSTTLPSPPGKMALDNAPVGNTLPVDNAVSQVVNVIASDIGSITAASVSDHPPPATFASSAKTDASTVSSAAQPATVETPTVIASGQKRQIEHMDDGAHEEPDFKRVATSGPPTVKT